MADLRRKLAAAKRALPPPGGDPWSAPGAPLPSKKDEVIEVLATDMGIPELPLSWAKNRPVAEEKLRRWLRSDWLHRPSRGDGPDPAKVRAAIVYRPTSVLLPKTPGPNRYEGGDLVVDVAVMDLEKAAPMCRALVHATNGTRLSFAAGGPGGLTPQEAMEVDLRRNLRERAHMTLIGLPRCSKLPPFPTPDPGA